MQPTDRHVNGEKWWSQSLSSDGQPPTESQNVNALSWHFVITIIFSRSGSINFIFYNNGEVLYFHLSPVPRNRGEGSK